MVDRPPHKPMTYKFFIQVPDWYGESIAEYEHYTVNFYDAAEEYIKENDDGDDRTLFTKGRKVLIRCDGSDTVHEVLVKAEAVVQYTSEDV